MANTVKGIYRNGRVELLQTPEGVEDGDVEVTLRNSGRQTTKPTADRRERARRWLREGGWNMGGAPYPTRDATTQPRALAEWRDRSSTRTS